MYDMLFGLEEVCFCVCRFGKYELHDLVVLDQQTTGIIISVEKDTCRVLTTEVWLSWLPMYI